VYYCIDKSKLLCILSNSKEINGLAFVFKYISYVRQKTNIFITFFNWLLNDLHPPHFTVVASKPFEIFRGVQTFSCNLACGPNDVIQANLHNLSQNYIWTNCEMIHIKSFDSKEALLIMYEYKQLQSPVLYNSYRRILLKFPSKYITFECILTILSYLSVL
jgi:hypothetical protein